MLPRWAKSGPQVSLELTKFVALVATCWRVSWPFQKWPASRLKAIVFWPVIGVVWP